MPGYRISCRRSKPVIKDLTLGRSAKTATTPGEAAAAAPPAAGAAAATATATATTTATATAATAGFHDLLTAHILLVEEMEGGEAGIGELFLTQRDRVRCGKVERLRRVGRGRRSGGRGGADQGVCFFFCVLCGPRGQRR